MRSNLFLKLFMLFKLSHFSTVIIMARVLSKETDKSLVERGYMQYCSLFVRWRSENVRSVTYLWPSITSSKLNFCEIEYFLEGGSPSKTCSQTLDTVLMLRGRRKVNFLAASLS